MIGVFLLPWPVRGVRAPYLWIFYKWLTALNETAFFIVGEDYLRSPDEFAAAGRWELDPIRMRDNGYVPPESQALGRHLVSTIPDELFGQLLGQSAGNPLALFRRLLTERIPELESALRQVWARLPTGALEAVITWCNCPSLSAVAAEHGVPVMHLEVGPLRAPLWRPTAYLDFRGVNGNTEAAARYAAIAKWSRPPDIGQLRRFFFRAQFLPKTGENRIGIALQVDDDSNLVAFGNGYDNQAVLLYAKINHESDGVLCVRSHPGSLFAARPVGLEVDNSYDSLAFIRRCRHVLTINSSLALEALLLETSATVLGDCSFAFVNDVSDLAERSARMAYFLFAYLIPEALQFDIDYLRFRLGRPSDEAIVSRHASAWLGNVPSDTAPASVWQAIDDAIVRSTAK